VSVGLLGVCAHGCLCFFLNRRTGGASVVENSRGLPRENDGKDYCILAPPELHMQGSRAFDMEKSRPILLLHLFLFMHRLRPRVQCLRAR
jgi:hypothetical protein